MQVVTRPITATALGITSSRRCTFRLISDYIGNTVQPERRCIMSVHQTMVPDYGADLPLCLHFKEYSRTSWLIGDISYYHQKWHMFCSHHCIFECDKSARKVKTHYCLYKLEHFQITLKPMITTLSYSKMRK